MQLSLSKIRLSTEEVIARVIRQIPSESRESYLNPENVVRPRYMRECVGTPRRELQVNMIDKIRLRPTFNPYQEISAERLKNLRCWTSRDWAKWSPYVCSVGVGGQKYKLPDDLQPRISELGESFKSRLSDRWVSDIKKQYIMHGLPWVWGKNFYHPGYSMFDRQPNTAPSLKSQSKRISEKTKDALTNMEVTRKKFREEKYDKKRLVWWERVVKEIGGSQAQSEFGRVQKLPRLT